MTDKSDHIVWAAEAVAVFQKHCRTGDEHVIADLICDLGHLAEDLGFDFLTEVRRGIRHWYAEQHLHDGEVLGRDAAVEIIIKAEEPGSMPRTRRKHGAALGRPRQSSILVKHGQVMT